MTHVDPQRVQVKVDQPEPIQMNMTMLTKPALWATAGGAGVAGGAVGGVLGTIAVALITGMFAYIKDTTTMDPKVIESAVAVLQADPQATAPVLRDWAIKIVEKRATFEFTDAQKQALRDKALPKPPAPPAQTRTGG